MMHPKELIGQKRTIITVSKRCNFKCIFNPPFSSWMVASCASLIQLVKYALKAIILDKVFTNAALYIFHYETEWIINERPLTAISYDVNDFKTLRRNHFLIGEGHPHQSPEEFSSKAINCPKGWRAVQADFNMLWIRRKKEYLPKLTQPKGKLYRERIFKCRFSFFK